MFNTLSLMTHYGTSLLTHYLQSIITPHYLQPCPIERHCRTVLGLFSAPSTLYVHNGSNAIPCADDTSTKTTQGILSGTAHRQGNVKPSRLYKSPYCPSLSSSENANDTWVGHALLPLSICFLVVYATTLFNTIATLRETCVLRICFLVFNATTLFNTIATLRETCVLQHKLTVA
jgi:hypothetical protein